MQQTIEAKLPTTIHDLKFRMLFRGKGEGRFLYRVTAIDADRGEIGFTRDHDGAKIIILADRFADMVRNQWLVFIAEN